MLNEINYSDIKILIIEDLQSNIRLVERTLQKYNYQILKAISGEEGIEVAKNENPDLILLDIMMPGGLNGYEVCKKLKQIELTKDIPILMLTAKGNSSDVVEGLNVGAQDYITKPFTPEILRARIRTALKIKLLNDSQKKQNKELAKLNLIKENFISMASHDIKNNLTGIIGHCYLLLLDKKNELNPMTVKSIQMIKTRSEKISNLVSNLLDLAKIESGNLLLNYSKVKLNDYLQRYFDEISVLYQNEDVDFKIELCSENYEIEFDEEKIDEILTNLITNAIKYTKDKGTITLKNELYKENKIKISVIDSGIGLDDKDKEIIFEKFTQLKKQESLKRTFKSSGLGLSIVKSIVEAHGGIVGVNSQLGKGSEFYFIIPLKKVSS
jgi:two-component system, sensor histidine kinase and response regulator